MSATSATPGDMVTFPRKDWERMVAELTELRVQEGARTDAEAEPHLVVHMSNSQVALLAAASMSSTSESALARADRFFSWLKGAQE